MTFDTYTVRVGKDGQSRFYMLAEETKVLAERQATKADIKKILGDVRRKREAYDKALLEYVK